MLLIYFIIIISTVCYGIYKYSQIKHTSLVWVWLYLLTVLIVEAIAFFLHFLKIKADNNFIFNICLPIYFFMIGLFFYKNYKKNFLKNIYLFLMSLFLVFYFIFIIFHNQSKINSQFYLLASWFIVCSAIIYFMQLIVYPNLENLLETSEFYIAAGLLFLYSFLIIYMSILPSLLTSIKTLNVDVKLLKSIMNILSYSVILTGFLCLQRKKI